MNEERLKETLSKILGKDVRVIERMEFVKIMESLVEVIEKNEAYALKLQKHLNAVGEITEMMYRATQSVED